MGYTIPINWHNFIMVEEIKLLILPDISFYQFPDSVGPNKNKRQSKWQTDIETKNEVHKTFVHNLSLVLKREFNRKKQLFLDL